MLTGASPVKHPLFTLSTWTYHNHSPRGCPGLCFYPNTTRFPDRTNHKQRCDPTVYAGFGYYAVTIACKSGLVIVFWVALKTNYTWTSEFWVSTPLYLTTLPSHPLRLSALFNLLKLYVSEPGVSRFKVRDMANSSEGKVIRLRTRGVKVQGMRYGQLIRGQSCGAPNQRCQDSRYEIWPTHQRAKLWRSESEVSRFKTRDTAYLSEGKVHACSVHVCTCIGSATELKATRKTSLRPSLTFTGW